MAQTVGFEPTVLFTAQTISSRSRYDLFDTSAYMSTHFRELNAFRTHIKFQNLKSNKPAHPKHSRQSALQPTHNISSRPRYDHFDTSP